MRFQRSIFATRGQLVVEASNVINHELSLDCSLCQDSSIKGLRMLVKYL